MLGLSTVKISAKSVTSIEQRSAEIGRGLGAMTPKGPFESVHFREVFNFSL
jgi:hypothetical protein